MNNYIELKSYNFELEMPQCIKLDDLEYYLVFTREYDDYTQALYKSSVSVDYIMFRRYKL